MNNIFNNTYQNSLSKLNLEIMKKNMEDKFETIVTSYINGNISWVKEQVKKLSKENRKALYGYVNGNYAPTMQIDAFFFNLI